MNIKLTYLNLFYEVNGNPRYDKKFNNVKQFWHCKSLILSLEIRHFVYNESVYKNELQEFINNKVIFANRVFAISLEI